MSESILTPLSEEELKLYHQRNHLGVEESHESYGVVQITHPTGPSGGFYGSWDTPDEYVELTISTSKLIRSHSYERTYQDQKVISVKMTKAQFVDMITSHSGQSIPVTFTGFYNRFGVDAKKFQSPPERKVQDIHEEEIHEENRYILNELDDISACVKDSGLSKRKEDVLLKRIEMLRRKFAGDYEFRVKMFKEDAGKIIKSAKQNLQSWAINARYATADYIKSLTEKKGS